MRYNSTWVRATPTHLLNSKMVCRCLISYNKLICGFKICGFKGVHGMYKRTYRANGEGRGGAHPSLRLLDGIIKIFIFLDCRLH